jgi:putative ABC transport system substrate-binding protein
VEIQSFEVRHARDLEDAFAAMVKARADAVVVFGSSLLFAQRAMIAELARKNRLPSLCTAREWTDAGFVMSYGPSLNDLYRRAPYFIDRILKGAKPADLPVEQPTKFELVIDLKTARELRLTIPSALMLRADEIIQ